MVKLYRFVFNDRDRDDEDRQTASLAGLAVTLLILVVCMFITRQLQTKSAIEDCLLAGHTNCDVLVPKLTRGG